MSQVLGLQSSANRHEISLQQQNQNLTLTIVFAMVVVAVVLSLLTTALPGWVFRPSDVTSFPLP
jgi:hypothetical protein